MDKIRSLVRPTVTWGLVLAQIGLAVAWTVGAPHAEQAFAGLGTFTMLVIRDYFASREDKKPSA